MSDVEMRVLKAGEADKFLELLIALDAETNFLLFEKDERSKDFGRCKEYLEKTLNVQKGLIFVVVNPAGNFVGHITGERFGMNKKRHIMRISIGILNKYYGTGRELMKRFLEVVDQSESISRLEAEILTVNKTALNMAKKFGFVVEGKKHNAVCIAGQAYDECMVARVRKANGN